MSLFTLQTCVGGIDFCKGWRLAYILRVVKEGARNCSWRHPVVFICSIASAINKCASNLYLGARVLQNTTVSLSLHLSVCLGLWYGDHVSTVCLLCVPHACGHRTVCSHRTYVPSQISNATNLSKNKEGKQNKKRIHFLLRDTFAALVLFRNEEENLRVRRQSKVSGGWSWRRQRLRCCIAHKSLINLCLGCWKLFLGHACKGYEMGAE